MQRLPDFLFLWKIRGPSWFSMARILIIWQFPPVLDDNRSGQIKIDQIRAMVPFMAHKPAVVDFGLR